MSITRRSILAAAACCARPLSSVAADLASAGRPGPYQVETQLGRWIDDSRDGRDVPWKAYLPVDAPRPAAVVVWSHGAGGSRDGAEYLGRHLASHGFAAFHIQHHGSDRDVLREKGVAGMLQAVRGVRPAADRMRDVPFAVDQIERMAREELKGRIDAARIGISGHSYGAITTQVMAGQKSVGFGQRFAEPRFRGAFAMSPSPPRRGSAEQAFEHMLMPIFHLTGTNDESPIGDLTPADRLKPFELIENVDQYLLVLDKGVHSTFSGRKSPDPDLERHHQLVRQAAVLFWKAYLLDDPQALQELQDGAFAKAARRQGRFEFRRGKG